MANHLAQRQSNSPFDPKSFYRFINTEYPKLSLSNGIGWPTVNMTTLSSYSSENWQIYYQQGRHFIRNYDSLSKTQYGLGSLTSTPNLLKTSASLGQQWTFTREGEGWVLTNGLLGNNSYLAIVDGSNNPVMQSSKQGAIWQIGMNGQGTVTKDPAMLVDLENFEVSSASTISTATPPSSTATTLATTTGATTARTTTGTSTLATSNSISSNTQSSASSSTGSSQSNQGTAQSEGLGTGAIAGISVGAVALVGALGLLGFILWRRSRSKKLEHHYAQPEMKPVEIGGTETAHHMSDHTKFGGTYAYRQELG